MVVYDGKTREVCGVPEEPNFLVDNIQDHFLCMYCGFYVFKLLSGSIDKRLISSAIGYSQALIVLESKE